VVARYADGRTVKGLTIDFAPDKDRFHVDVADAPAGSKPVEIRTADLKAIFFVKDLAGDPAHEERKAFDSSKPAIGRKIQVTFKDGELLVGTTQGYQRGRPGFFLAPADAESNIERCYVLAHAAQDVKFL
jgi:hypothetical protein